jgi:hypothetical protein
MLLLPPFKGVSIVIRIRAGRSGFDSGQEQGLFLFATASRLALGPTQTRIQWIPGALSPEVTGLGHEVDHSPPSSAERMRGAIPPRPNVFMARCLVKHWDRFTFASTEVLKGAIMDSRGRTGSTV